MRSAINYGGKQRAYCDVPIALRCSQALRAKFELTPQQLTHKVQRYFAFLVYYPAKEVMFPPCLFVC